MKKILFYGLALSTLGLCAVEPALTIDAVHQRWPWEAKIDIDFTLSGESAKRYDVALQFYDGDKKLAIADTALSGSMWSVAPGRHRVTLDPAATPYAQQVLTRFSVKAGAITEAPLYMIVDLTKAKGETGQIVYLTETDLLSGAYGTTQRNPIPDVSSLIWTGVTNDVAYATTKMVFRRINPGTFTMGYGGARIGTTKIFPGAKNDSGQTVTVSQPYFIAVFETTQAQWTNLGMSNYANFKTEGARRPVEMLGGTKLGMWSELRGSDAADGGYFWPSDGYAKPATSFLGKLENLLGLVCDLPTEAQWEYAARAGTTSVYGDGVAREIKTDADFVAARDDLGAFGRFNFNGGGSVAATVGPENGTALVGSYRPNAWGLYDTHGNVLEACLDRFYSGTTNHYDHAVMNPAGPAVGADHIAKGGGYIYDVTHATSGFRWSFSRGAWFGFRVVVFPEGSAPAVGEVYQSVDE